MSIKSPVKTLVTILGLSIAAFSMPAFASDDDDAKIRQSPMNGGKMGWKNGPRGERAMGWRMGNPQFMQRFAILDQNDDGRISDDEAAAQRESVFYAMDNDDDQELTEDEFMSLQMGRGAGRNKDKMEAHQLKKKARFAPMDTDSSGTVSKAEWMAEGETRFATADSNDDGIVTPWEFRSRPR
ncbi:MAG: hypothetical protein WBC71_11175 [Salaquimonas sp.]